MAKFKGANWQCMGIKTWLMHMIGDDVIWGMLKGKNMQFGILKMYMWWLGW